MKWLVSTKSTKQQQWDEVFVYGTLEDAMNHAATHMCSPYFPTKVEIHRVYSSTCMILKKSYEVF